MALSHLLYDAPPYLYVDPVFKQHRVLLHCQRSIGPELYVIPDHLVKTIECSEMICLYA